MKKTNKGITLIALIITIVVMLVLVGVIVSTTINSNLINKVKTAGGKWKEAEGKDGNIDGATIGGLKYNNLQDYVDGKIPTLNKGELEEKIEAIEGDALIDIHGAEVPLTLWGVDENGDYAYLSSYNGVIEGGKIQGNIPVMYKKDGEIYDVTELGWNLFRDKDELQIIQIPEGIKSLVGGTFSDCNNLKSVTLPKTLKSIGDHTFDSCTQLSNIKLPDSLETIGMYAFQSCNSLTSLEIPSNVSSIAQSIMNCSENLNNLVVDEDNQYFSSSDGILYNKDKTELIMSLYTKEGEVNVPSTVKKIADNAFDNCYKVTSIILPDNLETIGSRAFQNTNIQSLTIPASVSDIETGAFDNMGNLASLTVADANSNYSCVDGILYNKNKTELIFCLRNKEGEVTIPSTVTTIADYAFYNCGHVKKITIPDSVESIGKECLLWCYSLADIEVGANNTNYCSEEGILYKLDNGVKTEIIWCSQNKTGDFTIPDGVTTIWKLAFFGCHLTTINVPASVTEFGTQCLDCMYSENIFVTSDEQKDNVISSYVSIPEIVKVK